MVALKSWRGMMVLRLSLFAGFLLAWGLLSWWLCRYTYAQFVSAMVVLGLGPPPPTTQGHVSWYVFVGPFYGMAVLALWAMVVVMVQQVLFALHEGVQAWLGPPPPCRPTHHGGYY